MKFMKNSITVQDIANALGLSRNTVSKALNGKPVPAKTRNAVISAAIEMGYKGFGMAAALREPARDRKRLLILSSRMLMGMSYYVQVLRGIEEALVEIDAELIQFHVSSPASFDRVKSYLAEDGADGIICIEFFDTSRIAELTRLGLPLIFVDFPVTFSPVRGRYDIILPDSQNVVRDFCLQKLRHGVRRLGFVGDYMHCRSFYERFAGMREALFLAGEELDLDMSVLYADPVGYDPEHMVPAIRSMSRLPELFVAANDNIALGLMDTLASLGVRVPEDTEVLGFDNIAESRRCSPQLTTVNVNKLTLGRKIAALLRSRMDSPSQPNQIVCLPSTVISRESA